MPVSFRTHSAYQLSSTPILSSIDKKNSLRSAVLHVTAIARPGMMFRSLLREYFMNYTLGFGSPTIRRDTVRDGEVKHADLGSGSPASDARLRRTISTQ